MKVVLVGAAAAAALFALHRLALWMERRGWLYYIHNRPSASSLGNAFLEVQSLVEPGKRPAVEASREERSEAARAGDPPVTGGGVP